MREIVHWVNAPGIARAVVNFEGPIYFVVVSRYHGGAYVVFSQELGAEERQLWEIEWQAARKVRSCIRGEQEATTTRVKPFSLTSVSIISCPGSEHMNMLSLETTTPGSFAMKSRTSLTRTLLAILDPQ